MPLLEPLALILIAVGFGAFLVTAPGAAPISSPAATSPSSQGAQSGSTPPSIRPLSTPARPATWRALVEGDTAGAIWSPDGAHLLAWDATTNATPSADHVGLFDAAGKLIRRVDGARPLWLDATRYLVFVGTKARTYTVTSDAATLTSITSDGGEVSNGHGALAVLLTTPPAASSKFYVWTETSGASSALQGVPLTWSADGTELAVWHWTSGTARSAVGYVDVVRWPSLATVISLRGVRSTPEADVVQFSRDGAYLYVGGHIVDIAAATSVPVEHGPTAGAPVWYENNHLVVPDLSDGPATIYDVDGKVVDSLALAGDLLRVSGDGSTLASWDSATGMSIAVLVGSTRLTLIPPGPMQPPYVELSPDGSTIAIVAVPADQFEVDLRSLR